MKKLLIPLPPMPFPLKPAIVQKEGLLILASHEKMVESMFQARERGKGLTATEEFRKLSAGIGQSGNAFRFIHPRFFRVPRQRPEIGDADGAVGRGSRGRRSGRCSVFSRGSGNSTA